MRTHRSSLVVFAAVGALALASCAGDEAASPDASRTETGTPSGTDTSTVPPSATDTVGTSPATPSSPTSSPAPTSTVGGVPSLSSLCELQPGTAAADRITFAVPEGWQVEEGNCEFFDPALEELPEGSEPSAAIGIRVSDNDFPTVADTDEIDGEIRHVGARSGYQAVRIRGESAGQALRPEGQPVELWLVDLDAGTDEEGGTLVMSASTSDGASFQLAAQALDRMAQTVRVEAPAVEEGPHVVTRTEGGGTPWTVTHDLDEGCFRLRPGGPAGEAVDEACDIEPSEGEVAGAILADGDLQVAVGITSPLAVLAESDAATAPYGAVTTPVEGGSLFAYEAHLTPLDVRAVDATGETIGTGTLG